MEAENGGVQFSALNESHMKGHVKEESPDVLADIETKLYTILDSSIEPWLSTYWSIRNFRSVSQESPKSREHRLLKDWS